MQNEIYGQLPEEGMAKIKSMLFQAIAICRL